MNENNLCFLFYLTKALQILNVYQLKKTPFNRSAILLSSLEVIIISNTRKSVHQDVNTTRSGLKKKTRRSHVLLADFKVFGYLMKQSFEFLIHMASQTIHNSQRNSKKSSQTFMLNKIRYPNHPHSFISLICFLFMNY